MILLAKLNDLATLLLVVLAVTTGVLVVRTNRYFARQRRRGETGDSTTSSPDGQERSEADAPDELVRWEVQMHDTARRLSAQLDTKMAALQALIDDADRAAARLEAALGRPAPSAANTPAPDGPDALRPRRRDEIYTLADYGYDAAEIARRVGSPIGEVELILSLRGRQ